MGGKRILAICTSHDKLGATDRPTGLWIEELVAPYYILTEAGLEVDVASTKGGKIPIDPGSLQEGSITDHVKRYLKDDELLKKVENSVAIKDADETYDGVFLPGGHGIVYDGPENPELIALLEKHWAQGKVVSAVCHGPAGLCGVKDPDSEPIVKGRKVTGFTNSEEAAVGKTDVVPFLLEDKLKDLGGIYECGPNWSPFAVADGNLITGQNPQSSAKVAQLILAALG
eukprot:c20416_g1_i1 orf=434-1117(-)